MNPTELLAAAEEESGLSDWGDDSFREGLGHYCASLTEEAQLNELGALALQANVQAQLVNRLRVIDWAKTHDVSQEVIVEPVFVIGLFRAGTTLLSHLLDQDPANRSLLHWEAADVAPPVGPAEHRTGPRVDVARSKIEMLDLINPRISAVHREDADAPTECVTLMAMDFKSLLWESVANVPTYGKWLLGADHLSAYQHHKLCLQVLQSGGDGGQWSLKSPHHALALDALTAVYPDAKLLYLHRDPAEVAASAFSLIGTLSGTFSDADHSAYIQEHWVDVLVQCTERVDAFRDARPDIAVHDLRYTDLLTDPVAAVKGIYGFLGRELTVADQLLDYLERNPKGKHGKHEYPSAQGIRERFAPYIERYGV